MGIEGQIVVGADCWTMELGDKLTAVLELFNNRKSVESESIDVK